MEAETGMMQPQLSKHQKVKKDMEHILPQHLNKEATPH
jgi:hypothetical protein